MRPTSPKGTVMPLGLITRLDDVTIKRHCITVETDITTRYLIMQEIAAATR
jgi:hypothetical protein